MFDAVLSDSLVVKCLPRAGRGDVLVTALYTHLNVDVEQYCSSTYEEGAWPGQHLSDAERVKVVERFKAMMYKDSGTRVQVGWGFGWVCVCARAGGVCVCVCVCL